MPWGDETVHAATLERLARADHGCVELDALDDLDTLDDLQTMVALGEAGPLHGRAMALARRLAGF
jgi:glycosyltransferase A (GT-A) superfamily protein (DUF2064 family)